MADISIVGFFQTSRTINNGGNIVVTISEYQHAYKHSRTGENVDAKMIKWNVIFPSYFIKFVKSNFYQGMFVQVKGVCKPHYGDNAISVLGETIKCINFQKNLTYDDNRIKKSQKNNDDVPNLQDYIEDDF